MRKKTRDSKSWRIFRVKGIIATAKQIARETGLVHAEVLVFDANQLLSMIKENT